MNALTVVDYSREIICITDDVTLVILKDAGFEDAGVLKFRSGYEVEFAMTSEARELFADIDNCDPIELLSVIAQKADGK